MATLAAATPTRPLAIGIGFESGWLETIHPQPYDSPMDFVVTERGIHAAGGEPLEQDCEVQFPVDGLRRCGHVMIPFIWPSLPGSVRSLTSHTTRRRA